MLRSIVLFKGTPPMIQNLPVGPSSQRLYYLSAILLGTKPCGPSSNPQQVLKENSGVHFLYLSLPLNSVGVPSVSWEQRNWFCRLECILPTGHATVKLLSFLTEKCNLVKLTLTTWAGCEAAWATSGICQSSGTAAVFSKQPSTPPLASETLHAVARYLALLCMFWHRVSQI